MRGAQSLVERRFPYRLNVGTGGKVVSIFGGAHLDSRTSGADLINTPLQRGVVRARWQETVSTVSWLALPERAIRGAQSLVERRFPYRLNVGAGGNVANISEHISILAPSSPDLINTRLQGVVCVMAGNR